MDQFLIAAMLAAGTSTGIGLVAGARLAPIARQARRDMAIAERHSIESPNSYRPPGSRRDSSIIGFWEDALRHTDGSYTRLYELPLSETMLADDSLSDRRCDDLARMFCVELPPGTILQFRYSVIPDPGLAIAEHLEARHYRGMHRAAGYLHDLNVDYYKSLADSERFRYERGLLAVRVPLRHEDDERSKGAGAFIPALFTAVAHRGLSNISDAVAIARERTKYEDGVVPRIVRSERAAFAEAEKVFQRLELHSPLRLVRLDRDQAWDAIYKSHVLNASTPPRLYDAPGRDLREYLCGETIEYCGSYAWHGDYPVAMISLFVPPEPVIFAGSLRALTSHAGLGFRHTLITEFISMDKRTSKDELAKRTRHLERVNLDSSGRPRNDPDTDAALKDLQTVRRHIAGSGESLVLARFRILVYGPPAASRAERASSTRVLNQRCDQITAALHAIDGIDAAREEPAALLALYSSALLGEATADKTGREMMEVAHSMAALIPTETAWRGSARPHTLLSTASGRLTALNLWDKSTRSNIKSPLVLITGEPGSGKSVLGGRIINDALATQKGLRVQAVDVGGSLAPHAGVVGARYLRLHPDDPRTINIWDYPELEDGELPSEEQIALVVMDALTLRGDKDTSGIASDLLAKAVKEVYKNFAPRNGPGLPKVEPIHSFLVEMLENYDFGHPHLDSEARQLALKLEKYVGNPWVDQPTHPNFNLPSPYDVYELDSLEAFTPDLRMTLSNRIAARVVRAIGWKQADGTRSPLLAVFDEVHKYTDKYPNILEVIDKGARQGRKENAVTMLITQTYDDVRSIRGIRATAGVKIVGRQTGDFSSLVADAGLSDRAVSAIHAIKNLDGIHAQFVLALGSGRDQVVEMIQVDLSPAELWTFTSNPDERNARARVHALRPEWSPAEAIAWLAAQYPRGLAAAGLIEIDERLLARS